MRLAFFSNSNSIHLKEWSEHFAASLGHEVLVLSLARPQMPYEGVRIVHVGNPMASRKPGWFTAIPRIRRELTSFGADVLIAYRVVSYGFLARWVGFHPLVVAGQRETLMEADTPISRYCVREAIRAAELCQAWSPNIRDSFLRHGASPDRVLTCPRGVDLSRFPALRPKQARPLRIVMTRSLKKTYNIGQLLDAMPLVLAEEPDALCTIAGDGPLRGELEERIRALGLERSVRLAGRLDRDAIVSRLEEAQVYVSTSITDGLALSHFEAMAAGCFPVISDIGANRLWVRDGDNGFLVPIDRPRDLAEAVLRAWRDTELREQAIATNRALVEESFDRAKNMRRISEAYEGLVGRRA